QLDDTDQNKQEADGDSPRDSGKPELQTGEENGDTEINQESGQIVRTPREQAGEEFHPTHSDDEADEDFGLKRHGRIPAKRKRSVLPVDRSLGAFRGEIAAAAPDHVAIRAAGGDWVPATPNDVGALVAAGSPHHIAAPDDVVGEGGRGIEQEVPAAG